MFSELKRKYENSAHEKADIIDYAKNLHSELMKISDLGTLMNNNFIKNVTISQNGIYIELDSDIKLYINKNDYEEVSMSCLCVGNYEAEETRMVFKILDYFKKNQNFTVLDIGANVGWYTLNIMKKYPAMKVFSFEPVPISYERLKNNLILNHLNVERLINIGLYKENGKMDFYYDIEGSGASSLVNLRGKEKIDKIVVDVKKLEDWVADNELNSIDFIKCDVEGSELLVYQGGEETIKKYHPIVFSEMLRKWCAKFGYPPNDIIYFYKNMGYSCFVFREDRLIPFEQVTETTIETNYFFLHTKKHSNLINDLCK